ncbi:ICEBs1 excisionase [Lachnospiraceae bacterium]|nr:ICEBs1 excisionase [Lachnospiraceae bacterium]
MNKNYMVTAQDIVDMLSVSKGHAYKIIRQLNRELEDSGYIVVSGKVPRAYWDKKFYGYQSVLTTM